MLKSARLRHPHCRHARQLVAAVDDAHCDKLPSDSPVQQQLQRRLRWGCLNDCLLSQHFVHLLFVVAWAPQSLKSWDEKDQRHRHKKLRHALLCSQAKHLK